MAELLGGLGEGHVGSDGRIDDGFAALDADDPVEVSRRIVEEANGNRLGAGRDPGALRLRINVEDVRKARKNRLFPVSKKIKYILINYGL